MVVDVGFGETLASFDKGVEEFEVLAVPVACELRSPATAFGRVELFSFFRLPTAHAVG